MGLCVTLSRKEAEKVIMVHRRDTLRATKILSRSAAAGKKRRVSMEQYGGGDSA